MIPVPGYAIGTPFGARSDLWSCRKDSAGRGIHTGVDFPAPTGTYVVAARPGIAVWTYHGWYFGSHQLEIRCADGTRDFYAHMSGRSVPDGQHVEAGQHVGYVGSEGHVTGSHLHFERHSVATGIWSCEIVRNPGPSLRYVKEEDMPLSHEDLHKIRKIVREEIDNVLDTPMNELDGQAGEDLFINKSLRDTLKTIYRKVTTH